jgi:tRNA modification GTPase
VSATWSIQTPTGSPGAIAAVELIAASETELDGTLRRLGVAVVRPGRVALRDLCGIDRGLVARWSPTTAHLMPHGGAAVLRALAAALAHAGLMHAAPDPAAAYPEAKFEIEARMLAALARAASPLAIDLLLDQPRRWAAPGARSDPDLDRVRSRLIDPPLVVAIGAANIGKSSLANALAGRPVAIVADEPGTTRDHVGVLIELAGLVVRYVDTPGIRLASDPIEAEAATIARRVAAAADLLLRCADASATPPEAPDRPMLTVATRADLGLPPWRHDVAVSALTGAGLPQLAGAIRESLVPGAALNDPAPWRFWSA